MDRNERLGVYHRGPTFLGQFVTKPVVTQGTNRCQMKDMNKIFPEIPYGLLYMKASWTALMIIGKQTARRFVILLSRDFFKEIQCLLKLLLVNF